jgi:hypothetical protein
MGIDKTIVAKYSFFSITSRRMYQILSDVDQIQVIVVVLASAAETFTTNKVLNPI